MTKRQPPPKRPTRQHRADSVRGTDADAPYDVGFGRPPEHTRFRPGRSGNPKGRPKLRRNLKTVVRDALNEAITIREGERKRRTSRLDALVRTVLNKALQGEAKAIPHLIALMRLAGLEGDESEAENTAPLRSEDEALIRDFLRRFGGGSSEVEDNPHDGTDDQSSKDEE